MEEFMNNCHCHAMPLELIIRYILCQSNRAAMSRFHCYAELFMNTAGSKTEVCIGRKAV